MSSSAPENRRSGSSDVIVGTRIRQIRREQGLTQAELARQLGISPSYLNLIEWNKRRASQSVLLKAEAALGIPSRELDGTDEKRVLERLMEIAHLEPLAELGIEQNRTSELIGRFPGWARGIAALARSEREATTRAQHLSNRLSNDPFLSETVHLMLTRIAAIRSAAEILEQYPDVPPQQRERFTKIVHDESQALSSVGEALAAYLDKAEDEQHTLTPLDEVEAYFDSQLNHFPQLEEASKAFAEQTFDHEPVSRGQRAQKFVDQELRELIQKIVGDQPAITTSAARMRATKALSDYAVGAVLLPLGSFIEQAVKLGFDVEALAETFGVEIEFVFHRLATLPKSGDLPQFGYFRTNAAGTIIEMLGLEGLALPRYTAACPLWVLFRAQQSPETVIRQCALFPSGARLVFVARARHSGQTGFGKPRHYLTDMIAMHERDASRTVYAPDASAIVEEVGPTCRLCPRKTCIHRVDDPLAE